MINDKNYKGLWITHLQYALSPPNYTRIVWRSFWTDIMPQDKSEAFKKLDSYALWALVAHLIPDYGYSAPYVKQLLHELYIVRKAPYGAKDL